MLGSLCSVKQPFFYKKSIVKWKNKNDLPFRLQISQSKKRKTPEPLLPSRNVFFNFLSIKQEKSIDYSWYWSLRSETIVSDHLDTDHRDQIQHFKLYPKIKCEVNENYLSYARVGCFHLREQGEINCILPW